MIYYKTYRGINSQRSLVLIHGMATDGSIFSDLINNDLLKDCFIIVPDLRGCGQSNSLKGEYSIKEMAKDIIEVLERLGRNDYVLFGYSQGGAVAQEVVRLKPEIIKSIILANTFSNNTRTVKEKIESYLMSFLVTLLKKQHLVKLLSDQIKKDGLTNQIKIEIFEKSIAMCKKKAILKYVSELRHFDSSKWLSIIKCRTLIIRGDKDNAVPYHHALELNNKIEKSKLEIVKNAKHSMLWTHEKEMIEKIKKHEHYLWE